MERDVHDTGSQNGLPVFFFSAQKVCLNHGFLSRLLLVIVFSLSSIHLILALDHIHPMKEAIISIQFDAQVVALMTISILASREGQHRLREHSSSDRRSILPVFGL